MMPYPNNFTKIRFRILIIAFTHSFFMIKPRIKIKTVIGIKPISNNINAIPRAAKIINNHPNNLLARFRGKKNRVIIKTKITIPKIIKGFFIKSFYCFL